MKRLLLSLLTMLLLTPTWAKSINIETTYGLTAMQGQVQAKNLFANIAALKTKCPRAWKHWNDLGVSDAVIMEQTLCTVYGIDATWTDAPNPKYIGMPATVHDIAWPSGKYFFTDTWRTSFGDNTGQGEFVFYPGNSATEFCMWEEKWLGAEDVTDLGIRYKCVVVTPTWGDNGSLGYAEGWSIEGIRLTGPGHDYALQGIYLVGLGVWDMGEMGSVDVRSDQWDIGVCIVRGTPYLSVKTTVFNNVIAGVASIGGSLGGGAFADIESCDADSLRKFFSGDDNGRLFMVRAGFNRPGGGQWAIVYTKGETAVTGEDRGRWMGGPIVDAEGSFGITLINVNASSSYVVSDALYIVNGQTYSSSLVVLNTRSHGYTTEVFDTGNKFRVPAYGSFRNHSTTWYSESGGSVLINGVLQARIPTPCTKRLGIQRMTNGVPSPPWDFQRCLPSHSDYGPTNDPVPAPCSAQWVLGSRTCTTCSGGTQVCTQQYVSSGTCNPVTPKPADLVESQACTGLPVGTKQEYTDVTNMLSIPCTLDVVKKLTFTKLKVPTGTNVAAFAGYINDMVYVGFGGLYYQNPGQTFVKSVTPNVVITNNSSTSTLTLAFTTPVKMKYIIGSDALRVPFTAAKVVAE